MKYIILVPDGVADEPVDSLGGKTPLEAAQTPNMDRLAREGLTGLVRIIPPGMAPGSDVGNISVLGYDATKGFSGRAPLEAASMGILLKDNELAFRCNLVTVTDGRMTDYSAGHITIEEAARIMADLGPALSDNRVRFHTGKSYRHIAVVNAPDVAPFLATRCTPPHDILGRPVCEHQPRGPEAAFLAGYAERGSRLLGNHPVNKARLAAAQLPANALWFWGQGLRPALEPFRERYALSGGIISAVDLVNGIGRSVGMEIITVPGATGYYDTNYRGKAALGLASLERNDLVYIHVESTDEAGHNGDAGAKVSCVEDFDRFIVGPALDYLAAQADTRILVVPDHPTPVNKRTHTNAPVPFAMAGKGIEAGGRDGYNEKTASLAGLVFDSGPAMIRQFLG